MDEWTRAIQEVIGESPVPSIVLDHPSGVLVCTDKGIPPEADTNRHGHTGNREEAG